MTAPLVLTRPQRLTAAPRQQRRTVHPTPPPVGDTERIAATASSLAIACLEIFAGIRRAETIARWVEAELLEKIDRRAQLRAEIAPAGQRPDQGGAHALQAGRTRVCRVDAAIAEVTVMVRTPVRYRAVAIRLELRAGRWTMTALQTM